MLPYGAHTYMHTHVYIHTVYLVHIYKLNYKIIYKIAKIGDRQKEMPESTEVQRSTAITI